jgi:hypothetical protein
LTATVEVADTAVITAAVLDQHGAPFSTPPQDHPIIWTSASPDIASVADGVITGESPGQTTVTVQAGQLAPVDIQVTVEGRTVTGQLAFEYSGDREGAFSVNETFRTDGRPAAFAFTIYDDEFDDQDIVAVRTHADGRIDLVYFWVDGRVTSSASREIDDGVIIFNLGDDMTWDAAYEVAGGSVNFSSVGDLQMAGTFGIEMLEIDSEAALTVTNGTFDLPLLTDADFGVASADMQTLTTGGRELSPAAQRYIQHLRQERR